MDKKCTLIAAALMVAGVFSANVPAFVICHKAESIAALVASDAKVLTITESAFSPLKDKTEEPVFK